MSTPSRKLQQDLQDLSQYYDLWIDDWYRFVIIRGMNLPPGYNYATTDVLLELPSDYPVSPPGQGKYSVMINVNLRFRGRLPAGPWPDNSRGRDLPLARTTGPPVARVRS